MTRSKPGRWRRSTIVRLAVAVAILALWFPVTAMASGRDQISQSGTGLPDRPDPIKLPPRPARPTADERLKGGHIELHIAPAGEVWTEVEWQDVAGAWHLVDNWRGYASTQGIVRWFVKETDLNKGPFRWRIYLYEGGDDLGSSSAFYLPDADGAKVVVPAKVPGLAAFLP